MSIVLIGNNAPPVADIGLTDVLDGARKRREEDAFATPRGFVGQLVDLELDERLTEAKERASVPPSSSVPRMASS